MCLIEILRTFWLFFINCTVSLYRPVFSNGPVNQSFVVGTNRRHRLHGHTRMSTDNGDSQLCLTLFICAQQPSSFQRTRQHPGIERNHLLLYTVHFIKSVLITININSEREDHAVTSSQVIVRECVLRTLRSEPRPGYTSLSHRP